MVIGKTVTIQSDEVLRVSFSEEIDLLFDRLLHVDGRITLYLLLSDFVEPLRDFELLLEIVHLSKSFVKALLMVAHSLPLG